MPPIHAHLISRLQAHGGVSAADNGRNAEFTRYDGGMRKGGAYVGDDGSEAWEEGRPADVGGGGDEDFAGLELVTLFWGV